MSATVMRGGKPLARQTLYARRIKAELIERLGGKCELCPCADPDALEFDHIDGRDWTVNRLSYSARLAKYQREAEDGLLRLLCGPCNRAVRVVNDNGKWVPTSARKELPRTAEIPF